MQKFMNVRRCDFEWSDRSGEITLYFFRIGLSRSVFNFSVCTEYGTESKNRKNLDCLVEDLLTDKQVCILPQQNPPFMVTFHKRIIGRKN